MSQWKLESSADQRNFVLTMLNIKHTVSLKVYHYLMPSIINIGHFMSKAWGLSRLQSLYFSSEPESMPRSGEQCKHPGLSSEPAGPDCTKPPASPQPAHSPRVTQRPQQSCLCWPVIDDTQEFHSWPPCVFGLPWRPGENRVHWGYWVSQPWSRGKSLRGGEKEKQHQRGHCRSWTNSHHRYLRR